MDDSRFTPQQRELFAAAVRCRDQARYEEGLTYVDQVIAEIPESVPAHMLRAALCFFMEDFEEAANSFQSVIELSPLSEKASIGLFLSLAFSGDFYSAVDEMERFLSEVPDSQAYCDVCYDYPQQFGQFFSVRDPAAYPHVQRYLELHPNSG